MVASSTSCIRSADFFAAYFFLTRTHTHFTAHFRCCCCYLMGCLLFRLNYTHNYYRSMHLSTDAETGEQENRQQNCELTYKKRWKKRTHTHKNGIKFEIPMFCGLRVLLINYLPSSFMCLADRVVSKWIRGRVFDLHSPGIRGRKEKWLLVICSTVFFCLLQHIVLIAYNSNEYFMKTDCLFLLNQDFSRLHVILCLSLQPDANGSHQYLLNYFRLTSQCDSSHLRLHKEFACLFSVQECNLNTDEKLDR